MPRMHDPDLIMSHLRLAGATTMLKKAMVEIYKSGKPHDKKVWQNIIAEATEGISYLKARAKV